MDVSMYVRAYVYVCMNVCKSILRSRGVEKGEGVEGVG